MYVERTPAREKFTERDLQFITDTLADGEKDAEELLYLLLNPDESDAIYDNQQLATRLEEPSHIAEVSLHFYFYVMMRRALREVGIESREVTDYLADMLARFVDKDGWRTLPYPEQKCIDYEHELQIALQSASRYQRYQIHAFGGDRNLFLTGLHSRYIRDRRDRYGAPGVRFYEAAGRGHYLSARDHPMSAEFAMREVFDALAEAFPRIRTRLNYLAEEYLN